MGGSKRLSRRFGLNSSLRLDRSTRTSDLFALAQEVEVSELAEMQKLLSEIAGHVKAGTKADKRHAAEKLSQLAAIATTLGFTIRPHR